MKKLHSLLLIALLSLTRLALSADLPPLRSTSDLAADAALAKQTGVPVMLVFDSEDCKFCQRMKDEVLRPGINNGQFDHRVILRELDIDAGGKLTDFDGAPIRNRMFVSRYEVYATPTVILLGYRGELLSAPIIGYNGAEKYQHLIDDAIEHARIALHTRPSPLLATSAY